MYYIYDCNTEKYFTLSYEKLYRFVNDEGTVFGNIPTQKRNLKKKVLTYGVWWNECMGHRLIKYIVYDEFMNLVDYKVLEDWALNRYGNKYKQFSLERFGSHEFRNGPVRWTGGYSNGHYHRMPRTTNEMRANFDPDYKELCRPKRKFLPTSWDDLQIASRRNKRSWKKNKKKRQWM